jgi:hypothetical protein
MSFPETRMRRLRRSESLRALVRETALEPGDLIYPLFLCPGEGVRKAKSAPCPASSTSPSTKPSRSRRSRRASASAACSSSACPNPRTSKATGAWDDERHRPAGPARPQSQPPAAKKLVLIADVCLCEYTSHGHCGIVIETATASKSRTTLPRTARPHRRLPGPGRSRHRRPQRHDGRPRRRHPPPPSTPKAARTRPSSATPPSSPPPSTDPSARPPTPPRSSATARAIRWTAPTSAKPCARSTSTSKKART